MVFLESSEVCSVDGVEAWELKAAKQIGLNIRVIRTRRELTQDELGDLVEMKRSYLSEIENGKHNLSLTTMLRLAKALKCQLADIVADVKTENRTRKR